MVGGQAYPSVSGVAGVGATSLKKASRSLKEIEIKDVQEQLDSLRGYLGDLTTSISKIAKSRWRDVRGRTFDTVQEAEAVMKENLAASLVVALAVGILVGYLIRRGAD
jgi:ElaB/YqjD/DUF883 family membrane-anchored ribosome-binding protein